MTSPGVHNVYSLDLSDELLNSDKLGKHPNGFVDLPPRKDSVESSGKPKLSMIKNSHLNSSLEMPSPTVVRERFFPIGNGSLGNLSDTGNSQTPLLRNDSPLMSPSSPSWSASVSGCSQHTVTTQLADDTSSADSTLPQPNFSLLPSQDASRAGRFSSPKITVTN